MKSPLRPLTVSTSSFILWVLMHLFFHPAFAEEESGSTEEEAEAVVTELGDALREMGPFQAEYRVVLPNRSANLTLFHNPELRYSLMILDADTPKESRLVFLFEYGAEDQQHQEFSVTVGEPPRLARMSLTVEAELRDVSSPIGSLLFFAEQYLIATEKVGGLPRVSRIWPSLMLGLEERGFQMGVGPNSTVEGVTATWLSPEWVQKAERVQKTPETVVLDFPGGQNVVLQRATGLLARDHWPEKQEEFPQSITLLKHKPLDKATGIIELIPGFDAFHIQEAPPTQLISALYLSHYLQLNVMLAGQETFEADLEKHADAMAGHVKSEGRILLRDAARKIIEDYPHKGQIAGIFRQRYQEFSEAKPEIARALGFEGFLWDYFRFVEENPSQRLIPPLENLVGQIQQGYDQSLEAIPGAETSPVMKLHRKLMPPLMDAWRLDLLSATLEHAKTAE